MDKRNPEDELNCGRAAMTPVASTPSRSTRGWRRVPCVFPTRSRNSVERWSRWSSRTSDWRAPGSPGAIGEAGQRGPTGGRRGPRGQQPSGRRSHVLPPDAGLVPQNSPLRDDIELVIEQAGRCKKIVAGLLDFARQNKVAREPTNLNELVQRTVRTTPFARTSPHRCPPTQ